MKGKIFTPAEATRTLPLVRRIVADVRRCREELDSYEHAIHAAADLRDRRALAARRDELDRRLTELRRELEDVGCFLDDSREGIVKFYGERNSRIIYLSWRFGEKQVCHWHATDSNHLDRRPIDGDERVMAT